MWEFHNQQLQKLNQLYKKTSKQTKNRIQEVFDGFGFEYSELYNIANSKTKKRVNTYIEEWKDKGLLKGQFGLLANNIYKRTRVKNSEILYLLIYAAYVEEQKNIEEKEMQIIKEDVSYYYTEGITEVKFAKEPEKKKEHPPLFCIIPDSILLYLIQQAGTSGLNYEQYKETVARYNAEQIFRQATISTQQKKELKIDSDEFKNLVNKQNNARLCINDNKYSGSMESFITGWNNQAKMEGIVREDKGAKVKFLAVEDERTTKECQSLNGQVFNVKDWNEFKRYSAANESIVKYRCQGLVMGLNMPPINDHFHWCRSTFMYVKSIENDSKSEYNNPNEPTFQRKSNHYTNIKSLNDEIDKAFDIIPGNLLDLIQDTKFDITNRNVSWYDGDNNIIYLMKDANSSEIIHEIGHAIDFKKEIWKDPDFIKIQEDGLDVFGIHIQKINGYPDDTDFWMDGNKFISEMQRKAYNEDKFGNPRILLPQGKFNTKVLIDYFSEGFRAYFEESNLLKKKDINLYNYIEDVVYGRK